MKHASRFLLHPGWRVFLKDMGASEEAVLAHAALPPDLFSRSDAWLSPEEYFRLWQGLETVIGAVSLPLAVGRSLTAEAFDVAIFASLCSPNLNVALERLAVYKRLIGPMTMDVVVGRQHTELSLACYGATRTLPVSLGATELVFFTRLARLGARHEVQPLLAELVAPPPDAGDIEAFLGCRLKRGKANRLRFSSADAERPFLTENAGMWRAFEPVLRQRLSQLKHGTRMHRRVQVALLDMLPSGRTSLDEVAGRLALSRRSLQRHLAEESVSFRTVLDETRRSLAYHYLEQSQASSSDISFLLGFGDAHSFLRAFKAWTGKTPGEFRRVRTGRPY